MSITKEWDWSKNKNERWLIPCEESAFLAESWKSKGFKKVLDVGCGLGRHSVYMSAHGFEVTALDLSEYAVRYLEDWAQKEWLNLESVVGNMLSLPFEDNSFDCVIAYNVIYHTDTKGFYDTLSEIHRVLKPGGELFLTMLSKDTWGYSNFDEKKRIDENTILRDENETEMNVPHFYVDINDIIDIFSDWNLRLPPKEWCEYNLEKTEYFSKHWTVLAAKKQAKQ